MIQKEGLMSKKSKGKGSGFWSETKRDLTANNDLAVVLCSTINLPMRYWRSNFLFTGAMDEDLYEMTFGVFPAKPLPEKTHPVFCVQPLPHGVGAKVHPCSTKKPWKRGNQKPRYVQEGCSLLYTGFQIDNDSYLLAMIRLTIPSSMAMDLHFRGEVPAECVKIDN